MESNEIDTILYRLGELGYFRFANESDLPKIYENMREALAEWSCLDSDTDDAECDEGEHSGLPFDRRIYFADAEELAEGGVCDFLEDLKPVLEKEGVLVESLRDECFRPTPTTHAYYVWVNGQRFKIHDTSQGDQYSWGLVHKRTLEIVNELLEAARSKERAYGIASANDAQIAILSEELYEYICSIGLPESSLPYPLESIDCE